jgi:hypothetical protein
LFSLWRSGLAIRSRQFIRQFWSRCEQCIQRSARINDE